MMLLQQDRSKKEVTPLSRSSTTEALWEVMREHHSFFFFKRPPEAKEQNHTWITVPFARRKDEDDVFELVPDNESMYVVRHSFSSQDPEADMLLSPGGIKEKVMNNTERQRYQNLEVPCLLEQWMKTLVSTEFMDTESTIENPF
jgi:hypothetical protein